MVLLPKSPSWALSECEKIVCLMTLLSGMKLKLVKGWHWVEQFVMICWPKVNMVRAEPHVLQCMERCPHPPQTCPLPLPQVPFCLFWSQWQIASKIFPLVHLSPTPHCPTPIRSKNYAQWSHWVVCLFKGCILWHSRTVIRCLAWWSWWILVVCSRSSLELQSFSLLLAWLLGAHAVSIVSLPVLAACQHT